ncbi:MULTISPECIES: SMI1/KNR4 family protein [unclassified Desulfovibrio]|uniref:SMI1/KNR4 family protein n=1 Tax=unclassified Desulfovibrio TaxID=2593640 RepID=UPI0013EC8DF9|nr:MULTISPECIES: SMI1/KNR4 family protein [unclassified Desulfovibrio]
MAQETPKPGSAEEAGKEALAAYLPEFYAAVGEFPDLKAEPGLSDDDIAALEQRLDFRLPEGLKRLVRQCAAISMNGLSVRAAHFGPIVMPSSEALVIGELYLHNPGDRLLMLPNDETVYYLEQRNGAITKLADSVENFFNQTLPRHLYG